MARRILVWLVLLLAGASQALAQGGTSSPAVRVAAEEDSLAEQGKKVFIEQGCYGCHTVRLTGTPIGPDLSHVGAKYSPSYLAAWLRDPSAQKPTAHMPRISLTDAEVRALTAYLASLE